MHQQAQALGALVVAAAAAAGQTVTVNFDFYPGLDGRLGTPDDVPIVAPTGFAAQTEQLTDQFTSERILFTPAPPVDGMNEILDAATFSTPPSHTTPNLLASSGSAAIEGVFGARVFRMEALIGISGGADTLEVYDFQGVLLRSVAGDDEVVTVATSMPIHSFRIFAHSGGTPAIDNLTFEIECYPDCQGNQGLDVLDFLCFQDSFVAMDPYADCDRNGTFDIFDFLCYQDAFLAGCP